MKPRVLGESAAVIGIGSTRRSGIEPAGLTQQQAADFLNCSPRYVRVLHHRRLVRCCGRVGRKPLYALDSLRNYLKGGADKGESHGS